MLCLSFDFQSQCASWQKEREHRECCSELQRLRTQLEKDQSSLHSQELELERLRPLEMWLGLNQREQQVSTRAAVDSDDHVGPLPSYITKDDNDVIW